MDLRARVRTEDQQSARAGPNLTGMSALATAPSQIDPARYRRNIRVYYLFMASTGFMIFLPIWIIYLMNGRGLSLTEVGVFEAVFWITIIVAEVPTGAVADRFGRRISLALGAFMFAISTVIFAMADSFSVLLGSYLVMGIAMTLYSGAGDAFLYDTLRVLGRTREYERLAGRSHGLFWAMMVVATVVGGPVSYLLGYSAAILISSVFFVISGVFALLLREPPRRESDFLPDPLHAPPSDVHHSSADQQPSGVPIFHEMLEGFRIVWRIRPVRYLVPFAAVMIALFDMPRFLTQPFVAQHGLDPLASVADGFIWSALLVPAYLGSMIGMLSAGQLMARFGERRSFPAVLLFGAVFMIPLAIWNHLGLLGAIFMISIAQAAVRPIASGYINRRISSDMRATVLSIFSLIGGGAMGVILVIVVPAADALSFPIAFGIALAMVVTIGVGLWMLWRMAHRRDQAQRMRRWSLGIVKPQALHHRNAGSPAIDRLGANGRNGQNGTDDAKRALFPNVQNLD